MGDGGAASWTGASQSSRGSRTWLGAASLLAGLGALLAYLVMRVPVAGAQLPSSARWRHWPAAVAAFVIVGALDALALGAHHRGRWRGAPATTKTAGREVDHRVAVEHRVPAALRFQRVPLRTTTMTAAASATLLAAPRFSTCPCG